MNDDLERLEVLYHDIIAAREGEGSDSRIWDCLERLGQEMLILRVVHNFTERETAKVCKRGRPSSET